jgi:hypothetical protein
MFRYAGRQVHASHKPLGITLLLVAAAALALLVPFMVFGNASGHDFEFHLASWMDVVHQWHQRVLYPRWAELANWGYGEPRFVFYPPLSWMLGAALSLLLPWPMVPGAFFWICMVLAGACMFRLAREWLPPDDAGFAALLYALNPYHQLHIYWRSDFAELLASAIFPLVVLYAIRTGQGERRAVLPLAAVVAAAWLMNAPAAVVSTYTVALLLAVTAFQRRSWRGIPLGAGALLLGFALATFYILPAAYEQRWVNIVEALASGLRPQDNFLFTWTSDPEHTYFNFRVSKIAVAEMLVAALALFAGRKLRERRDAWWPLITLLGASALLMLRITTLAWRFLPELHFVQFPWRWLFAFNAVLAVLLAAAVARRGRAFFWAGSVLALALCAVLLAHHAWWDSDGANDLYQSILVQGKGYFGADEYGARGSDHYDLDPKVANVAVEPVDGVAPQARLHLERWRAERKVFTVRTQQPVMVALRLMTYPAWRVTVNGRPAEAQARPNTSQMLIRLPAGASRVELRFTRTPDRLWGGVISALAAALWLLLALLQCRTEEGPYPLPAD